VAKVLSTIGKAGSKVKGTADEMLTPDGVRRYIENTEGRLNRGGAGQEEALTGLVEYAGRLDKINPQFNRHFRGDAKAQSQAELFAAIERLQGLKQGDHRAAVRPQQDIPGTGGMLDEAAILRGEMDPPAEPLLAYSRNEPRLPFDDLGDLNSELLEMNQIDREMRQVPSEFHNPGLAEGNFMHDPFTDFRQKTVDPGRQWTPAEIANLNNPHPDKTLYGVGGAVGLGAALDNDAPDPGVLAEPTLQDVGGRVGRLSDDPAAVRQRARDVIGDVPGFVGGVARHLGGMAAGGLAAIGQAGATSMMGNPADIGQLNETVDTVRGAFGGVDDDNEVLQSIGRWLESNPAAMSALQKILGLHSQGSERAYGMGPEAYTGYHAITEGLGEIL
jgi:hypothetical protein